MKYLFQFLRLLGAVIAVLGALLPGYYPFYFLDAPAPANFNGSIPYAIGLIAIGLVLVVISSIYLKSPMMGQMSGLTRFGNGMLFASIVIFSLPALLNFPGNDLNFLPAALLVFVAGLVIRVRGKKIDSANIR